MVRMDMYFIQPFSIDGYQGHFQGFAVKNSAVINILNIIMFLFQ